MMRFGYAADNLAAHHREQLEVRRGVRDDDDAEIQFVAFQLLADGDRSLFVEIDVKM